MSKYGKVKNLRLVRHIGNVKTVSLTGFSYWVSFAVMGFSFFLVLFVILAWF